MPTAKRIRDGVHANWYWLRGRTLGIHPTPTEDTQEKTSGACTVSGSVVTPSSFSYEKNTLTNYLCIVGTSLFIIESNTTSTFTVNGTPDSSAVTFTIYKLGIQIWYSRIPTYLTSGTDNMPGQDIDTNLICMRAARDLLTMLPKTEERIKSILNISRKIEDKYRIVISNKYAKTAGAPLTITPLKLRSDAAGYDDISGTTTDESE